MKKINLSKQRILQGQVILEFTFCMVVLMLMIYGVFMVFAWTGKDLAERRRAHEDVLFSARQVDPYFYKPIKMNAIWQWEWTY